MLFAPFDIADGGGSASRLAKALREGDGSLGSGIRPGAPVAVLVNNAGLAYKGDAFGAGEAKATLDTNFRGTRAVTRALLPVMLETCGGGKGGGGASAVLPRVVNVTSSAAGLGQFDRAAAAAGGGNNPAASAALKRRFLEAGEAGGDEAAGDALLDALASEFERGVADGSWRASGWPGSMYGVSKALENAYSRQLALRGGAGAGGGGGGSGSGSGSGGGGAPSPPFPRWTSVAVHPGYIATSMSSYKGPLPPSRGADTIVWAALLAPGGDAERASGAFYHDRQLREY